MKIYTTFVICLFSTCIVAVITCGVFSPKRVLAGQYALLLENDKFEQGQQVIFNLVYLQTSSSETVSFPEVIDCELALKDNEKLPVQARPVHKDDAILSSEKTTHFTRQYSFMLPEHISGEILVRLFNIRIPAFLVHAAAPQMPEPSTAEEYKYADTLFDLYQPYLKNISAYEPMYFLIGTDPKKSKFQISFKYRFLNTDSSITRNYPWIAGFYLGYTQVSFWDLQSDSTPFTDTSYKPEIFWESENFLKDQHGSLHGLFLKTGVQHHSNGEDGDISRSKLHLCSSVHDLL